MPSSAQIGGSPESNAGVLKHEKEELIDPVDQILKCWWPLDITALFVIYNISKYGIRKFFCFWIITNWN